MQDNTMLKKKCIQNIDSPHYAFDNILNQEAESAYAMSIIIAITLVTIADEKIEESEIDTAIDYFTHMEEFSIHMSVEKAVEIFGSLLSYLNDPEQFSERQLKSIKFICEHVTKEKTDVFLNIMTSIATADGYLDPREKQIIDRISDEIIK